MCPRVRALSLNKDHLMQWEVKRRKVKKMEEEREASVREVIRECAGGGRSVRKFLLLRDRWWENNTEC